MSSRIRSNSWTISCVLVLSLAVLTSAHAQVPPNPESTATLPLEKILAMQKQIDDASEEVETMPPMPATVQRVKLLGRLLEDGVEFTAHYDIDVLADDTWIELPLLRLDGMTHLLDLPKVKDGAFAVVDGTLRFITKKRKRYQFNLSILKEASAEGDRRSLRLELTNASVLICKLTFDTDMFELSNTRVLAKPDGVLVFPTKDTFAIEWVVRESTVVSEVREKPEIASVIPAAYASSVSTLEGTRITRLLYQLRFAGRKAIEFAIPTDQTVERAYLNGFAVPVEMLDGTLRIEAAPARAGDGSATIELVLIAEEGVYHLAGELSVGLPRASWPINEIFLNLHLPDVFTYQWQGGSLSPVSGEAMPVFTYRIPLPGKQMSFHQYLVSAHAPHLSLDYAVDLEEQYFCAE